MMADSRAPDLRAAVRAEATGASMTTSRKLRSARWFVPNDIRGFVHPQRRRQELKRSEPCHIHPRGVAHLADLSLKAIEFPDCQRRVVRPKSTSISYGCDAIDMWNSASRFHRLQTPILWVANYFKDFPLR